MPAAERQIAQAVLHSVRIRSILKVLLISAGEDIENDHFSAAFGHAAKVTVVKSILQMQSNHMEEENFDCVILNRFLVHDAVNTPKTLEQILSNVLRVLKLGGTLIVREDLATIHNASLIARLTDIFDIYRTAGQVGLDFYSLNGVDDSVYARHNWLDVFWTLKKQDQMQNAADYDAVTFRDFLDKTQYQGSGIAAYEWIFGQGFISPGGSEENLVFLKRLHHATGDKKMLDIGVGIGGSPRQAAHELGLHVTGIDLSSNMLSIAMGRAHQQKDTRVRLQICDVLKYHFHAESFDYVYSRDCVQHLTDLPALFQKAYHWLRPGGQLLITLYGKGHGQLTQKFKDYVQNRHYFLHTIEELDKYAKDAGFEDVVTENLTPRFKEILQYELTKAKTHGAEFLDKFDEETLTGLIDGWNAKLQFIADDNHNWHLVQAVKPHRQH